MPFPGTRQDVSDVVVDVIRSIQRNPTIGEATAFGQDIIVTSLARRNYAGPIINTLDERFPGTVVTRFSPDVCAQANRVRDIVDSLWDELQPQ